MDESYFGELKAGDWARIDFDNTIVKVVEVFLHDCGVNDCDIQYEYAVKYIWEDKFQSIESVMDTNIKKDVPTEEEELEWARILLEN